MMKMSLFFVFALTYLVSSSYGNAVLFREENSPVPECGGYMFVDDQVVIDGPFNENCMMQFETQGDRILAFSVVDGDIKDVLHLLKIQDGFGIDSPVLKIENQIVHEVSRQNAPTVLYTKSSEASVQFTKMPVDSNFQLKISKAVDCPLGIGDNTQCGRVVDEVSCYCATFTARNFFDQTMFCLDNKMKSVVFENKTEEDAIQKTWGTVYSYWTSLTDFRRDGSWVWESTMTVLNVTADYTNWFPGRPNVTAGNIDDCMLYGGGSFLNFWGDVNCAATARGICELQP